MSQVFRSLRSASVGTATTTVGSYVAPTVTTGVVVTGLVCTNRTAASITVTVSIQPGSDTQPAAILANAAPIIAGGSLYLADEGNRLTLNPTNFVQVSSSAAASLDVVMSVSEIT